ncbi:MAG: TIR domain-containing protein [Bacteroidales bacterium]|nr:TIR domain-containing protein [Bacteroidales bacterium]
MKNTEGYEYYAFISYKRENVQWAKWLHHKLEHYRLPANIRKNNKDLPNKIRPIFQDSQELSGGLLSKSIENSLRQSKYLIVICSPLSAKSPWVNREVQTFIDFGREENIIPFIIDGTPFSSTEEKECFPPALLNLKGARELLGISINEMGRDAAIVKVVARMFDLKFDTLWQRYEREKKRKRFIITSLVLAFALISLGIGSYIFRLNNNLEKSNKSLKRATLEAQKQRDRANEESKEKQLAYDSVLKQQGIIQKANEDLLLTNNQLREERDKVKKANWKMMENQSRVVAEQANKLIDEGDSYTARLLLLSVLPKDLSNPDRPYTPEVEATLRRAIESETGKIKYLTESSLFLNCRFNSDGTKILCHSGCKTSLWNIANGMQTNEIYNKNGIIGKIWNYLDRIYISYGDSIQILDNNLNHLYTYNFPLWKREKHFILNTISSNAVLYLNSKDKNYLLDMETSKSIPLNFSGSGGISQFSRDGNILLLTHKDTLFLYNTKDGLIMNKWIPHIGDIKQAMFSEDYKYIITSTEGRNWITCNSYKQVGKKETKIWNTQGECLKTYNCIFSNVRLNDNKIYTTNGKTIYILSQNNGDTLKVYNCYNNIEDIDISSAGKIVATLEDNSVVLLDENVDMQVYNKVEYERNFVPWYIKKHPTKNIFYTAKQGDSLYVIGYKDNYKIKNISETYFRTFIEISPYGDKLATQNSMGTFIIYDTKNFDTICYSYNSKTTPTFKPNADILVTGGNKIDIWNFNEKYIKTPIRTLQEKADVIKFNPKGDKMISLSMKKIIIWNTETWDSLKVFHQKRGDVYYRYTSFSTDGTEFLIATSKSIIRFNAKDFTIKGIPIYITEGNGNIIQCFYSKDDKNIIVTTTDKYRSAKFIDKESGVVMKTLNYNLGGYIVEGDNNEFIYCCPTVDSNAGKLVRYKYPSLQDIITEQRRRFEGRVLTDEEKRRYYLE